MTMNSSILGKDPQGRYWFKSDQRLTDITDASSFYVQHSGWFKKTWELMAVYMKRAAYYRDNVAMRGFVPAITEHVSLGFFDRHNAASMALEQLMHIKEIREIDPLTGK